MKTLDGREECATGNAESIASLSDRYKWRILWFSCLLFSVILFGVIRYQWTFQWVGISDGSVIGQMARNIAQGNGPQVDYYGPTDLIDAPNYQPYWPALPAVWSAMGILIFGDVPAAILFPNTVFFLLICGIPAIWTYRRAGPFGASIVLLICAFSPAILDRTMLAYNDLGEAFFITCAGLLILKAWTMHSWKWLAAASAVTGLAIIQKTAGGVLVLAVVPWCLLNYGFSKRNVVFLCGFLGMSFCASCPLLIGNFLMYGGYRPANYELIQLRARYAHPLQPLWPQYLASGPLPDRAWWELWIWFPFLRVARWGFWLIRGSIVPLALFWGGLVLLFRRDAFDAAPKGFRSWVLLLVGLGCSYSIYSHNEVRYFSYSVPWFAMLLGVGVPSIWGRSFGSGGRYVRGAVVIFLLAGLVPGVIHAVHRLPVDHAHPWVESGRAIDRIVPERQWVLVSAAEDDAAYHVKRKVILCSGLTEAEIDELCIARGIRYLVCTRESKPNMKWVGMLNGDGWRQVPIDSPYGYVELWERQSR